MPRRSSIDQHPQRAEIIRAISAGSDSLRTIAKRFNLTQSSVQRFSAGRLPQAAAAKLAKEEGQGLRDAEALLGETERVVKLLEKMLSSLDEFLSDPEDPTRYTVIPRDSELEIIYTDTYQPPTKTDEEKPPAPVKVRRKERLSTLLARRGPAPPFTVLHKGEDPRRLLLATAGVLGEHLDRLARILGIVREIAQVNITSISLSAHPAWPELTRVIFGALQPFPEARAALLAALDRKAEDPDVPDGPQPARLLAEGHDVGALLPDADNNHRGRA